MTITGTTLSLVNDDATPGNDYFYGTNGSGVKGWYALSSEGVNSITGTTNQIVASASTGAVTLSLSATLVSINSITSTAGQPLVLATGTSGTALTIASATNAATFAGTLTVSGTGPHAVGGATLNAVQVYLRGAYSPTGSTIGEGLLVGPALTIVAGNDANLLRVSGTLIEAASGTHANLIGARFDAPTITDGAATTTNAATVKITGAPTAGVNNYSLWVSAGDSLLAGNLTVTGTITATSTSAHTLGPIVLTNGVVTNLTSIAAPTTTDLTLAGGSSGASLVLGQGATKPVALTTGSGHFFIDGGNVGIGTAVPDAKLHIHTTIGGAAIKVGVTANEQFAFETGITADTNAALVVKDVTTPATYLTLRGGSVLIGGTTAISGTGGLKVFGTTASTSTTTGSLINAGGFGNAGAANIGGNLTLTGADSRIYNGSVSGRGILGNSDLGAYMTVYGSSHATNPNEILLASVASTATLSSTGLALSGTLTASGTGTHTFGTTNTVTMAAGVLTANGAGLHVLGAGNNTVGFFENTVVGQTGVNAEGTLWLSYYGYNGGITQFRNTQIGDGKGATVATFTGSSKLTTLAGNLTASGTGTHTFGTTNTVTMAAGVLTTTGAIIAGTQVQSDIYRDEGATRSLISFSGVTTTVGSGSPSDITVINSNGTTAATFGATGNTTLAGDLTVSGGNVGVGGALSAAQGLRVVSDALTGSEQYGVVSSPAFSSAATSLGFGIWSQVRTAAAAFTMTTASGLQAASPGLGAGSSITTNRGLFVDNQGATGITTSLAIDVAAQSGASSISIGIRNAASTQLKGALALGVTSTATAAGTLTLTANGSTSVHVLTGTAAHTVQLPAANALGSGIAITYVIKNRSTGVVTVQRAGSDTIDGSTSYALATNDSLTLVSDGSALWAIV